MMGGQNITPGRFITVEGTEGVGKSTNMDYIAGILRSRGIRVVVTREPGGTPVAERIRDVVLQSEPGSVSDRCELLLMFAARASHIDQVIRPALTKGEWVLCDRFVDATYAYQGGGRRIPDADIDKLSKLVLGNLRPDLTILLDAPAEVTQQRRSDRGTSDRFEQEEAAFFNRVQSKYREIAQQEPDRVRIVDASVSLKEVQESLKLEVDKLFK
ncbi:MAG: dTMP kinase [Gammaproteobacteria bacterium]|nr:dTMP kinase [Gammaproteobacteria bacterium]